MVILDGHQELPAGSPVGPGPGPGPGSLFRGWVHLDLGWLRRCPYRGVGCGCGPPPWRYGGMGYLGVGRW